MNKHALTVVALVVGAFISSSGAAVKKPSKISAYAGSSRGTVVFAVSSLGSSSGTTNGSFTTSKKKEVGTLTLASSISSGTFAGPATETYQFHGRQLVYGLSLVTGSATGSGSASIGKSVITYSGTFSFLGTPYTVQGTIRQTKKRLFVAETLTTAGLGTATFNYTLKRRIRR